MDINVKDETGQILLHYIDEYWDTDVVELLIEYTNDLDVKDKFGFTLLHCILPASPYLAKLLIEKGSNVNAETLCGKTPLICASACRIWDSSFVEFLIEKGAHVNVKDKYGVTPLYVAVNNLEIANCLLDNGADVNYGKSSLLEALSFKSFDLAEQLIEKGTNVNVKDEYGLTPLHYAATHSDGFFVDLLINKGAKINVKANDGMAPVDWALQNKNFDTIRLLIYNGADINISSMDIPFFNKLGLYYHRLLGKFFK